jgi:hypothetical protein
MRQVSLVLSPFVVYLNLIQMLCGARPTIDGVATCDGMDGPDIESRCGGKIFHAVQTVPKVHLTSCTIDTGVFPGCKAAGA